MDKKVNPLERFSNVQELDKAIYKISKYIRMARVLEETGTSWAFLEGITFKELKEKNVCNERFLMMYLNELHKLGFIFKEQDKKDKRVWKYRQSARGWNFLIAVRSFVNKLNALDEKITDLKYVDKNWNKSNFQKILESLKEKKGDKIE